MPDRTKITRRIEIAIIVLVFVCIGLANIYYDYLPSTLRTDEQGVVRGSGTKTYNYPNGSPRITEKYVAGFLRSTRWHRSDGSVVVETKWREGVGDSYVVDEDGTIIAKFAVVFGVPEGAATFYRRDGTVARKTRFHDGVEVANVTSQTPATGAAIE